MAETEQCARGPGTWDELALRPVCVVGVIYADPDEQIVVLSCELAGGHEGLHRDLDRGIQWGPIRD